MIKKPNCFIVGAAKSGTTSMRYYLEQHPEIFMTKQKETNYFVFKGQKVDFKGPGDDRYINKFSITDEREYINLFKDVKNEKIIGESSPAYMYYYDKAAENIKNFNPDAKIIIILRNPVERAYSSYLHMIRDKREYLEFKDALKDEERRRQAGWEFIWYYKDTGLYYNQVKTYLDLFGNDVLIIIIEEFQKNPLKHFKRIFDFLEVDNSFIPFFSYLHNISSENKNIIYKTINDERDNILKKIGRILFPRKYRLLIKYKINIMNKKKPKIDKDIKMYLEEFYKGDIINLSQLLKKDLFKVW